ncbi:MAG: hypothetical protein EA376_13795 [Phycisphaeraceae bacterium]|nr:MAG: hypothetical protein EA376_13795 [Phycisphaeraceae bacterium]
MEEGGGGFAGGFVVVGVVGDVEEGGGRGGAGADEGHAELEVGDALVVFEEAPGFGGLDEFEELAEFQAVVDGDLDGVVLGEDDVVEDFFEEGGFVGRMVGALWC